MTTRRYSRTQRQPRWLYQENCFPPHAYGVYMLLTDGLCDPRGGLLHSVPPFWVYSRIRYCRLIRGTQERYFWRRNTPRTRHYTASSIWWVHTCQNS